MQSPSYSIFKQSTFIQLPEILVLDFSRAFFILDRFESHDEFPAIDTEALMGELVEQLTTPTSEYTWRHKLECLMRYVLEEAHVDDIGYDYVMLRKHLFMAMARLEGYLMLNKLYISNQLPYEYVQRKHSGYALLRRKKI